MKEIFGMEREGNGGNKHGKDTDGTFGIEERCGMERKGKGRKHEET